MSTGAVSILLIGIYLVFWIILLVVEILPDRLSRADKAAEQARLEAAARAYRIQQQEAATTNAIRQMSHQAVAQMMQEAREQSQGRSQGHPTI